VFIAISAFSFSATGDGLKKVNSEMQQTRQEWQQGLQKMEKATERVSQEPVLNVAGSPNLSTGAQPDEPALNEGGQSSASKIQSCADSSGVDEEIDCLLAKNKIADKELNDEYKKLMPSLDEARKTNLKIEQRAWLKEKEQKCDATALGYQVGIGSGWKVGPLECELEMINQRVVYLKNYK
jgi:uncharacterized protein YecT (DUF1311 family)